MTQVVVSSGQDLRQEIWAENHALVADEPVEAGGGGAGPSPYELLLAALGACTGMTLVLYARRKEWPLEQVEVRLTHDRIHARDCEQCDRREGFLDRVRKEIVVAGALSPEQVARLAEIAEKCPVNRTLVASVHVTQEVRLAP